MGNITLTRGGTEVSGVLFAPFGKVTFIGTSFKGTVIARDGFFVTSGGTTVTYKSVADFYSSAEDYPWVEYKQICCK